MRRRPPRRSAAPRPSVLRRSPADRQCRRCRRRGPISEPRRTRPRPPTTGSVGSLNTVTPAWPPTTRSCSTAAGRCRSAATSNGFRPCCFRTTAASLAAVVVLPDPCRPANSTTVGRARSVGELEGLAAEDPDQLLVDRLDDLLAGGETAGERLATAAVAHRGHEPADHAELDVGLQEGGADLAQRLVEIGVGQPAAAPQATGDALQAVGQGVEHGVLRLPGPGPAHGPGRGGSAGPGRAVSPAGRRRTPRVRRAPGRRRPRPAPPASPAGRARAARPPRPHLWPCRPAWSARHRSPPPRR